MTRKKQQESAEALFSPMFDFIFCIHLFEIKMGCHLVTGENFEQMQVFCLIFKLFFPPKQFCGYHTDLTPSEMLIKITVSRRSVAGDVFGAVGGICSSFLCRGGRQLGEFLSLSAACLCFSVVFCPSYQYVVLQLSDVHVQIIHVTRNHLGQLMICIACFGFYFCFVLWNLFMNDKVYSKTQQLVYWILGCN